jgi:tRNA modification GTPase
VVLTKCDLPRKTGYRGPALEVSAVTGSGLDALRSAIRSALVHAHGGAGELVASTALRCGDALRLLDTSLHRACRLAAEAGQEELVAAELRVGLEQLGLIVGDVVTEDILDRVFSRFCIGK